MILAAHYRTGETFEFLERGGRLKQGAAKRGRTDLVFGPGFFDLQCNGYAGIDFNSPNTTPEQLAAGFRAMWREGCTEVFPTLVTNTTERFEQIFRNFCAALKLDPEIERAVPGFHLEGPFISPVDGARGAHPLAAVSPVRAAIWKKVQRAAEQRIKLVTLAPEVKGAIPFIRQLREEHIIPAIGHTMADRTHVTAAADAGALLSTHLGNGCPQQMHRHYNPVMAQLGEDRLTATLITDGIHLPPEVVKAFARGKGPERTVVITDAMSAAGAPPGRYPLSDLVLEVGPDRVVRFPGSPMFAGSALTMDRAVSGYRRMAGVSWAEAWDAASTKAWQLFRAADPSVKPSKARTIARIKGDELEVIGTTRGGLVA
jgi:N-acetylglucosamine-6-phosphate deacetylase